MNHTELTNENILKRYTQRCYRQKNYVFHLIEKNTIVNAKCLGAFIHKTRTHLDIGGNYTTHYHNPGNLLYQHKALNCILVKIILYFLRFQLTSPTEYLRMMK